MRKKLHEHIIYWLPSIGIAGFILLFFIATLLYPGGSYHDRKAEGFSWMHNYWCNLMEINALNGQPNTARLTAITATFSLCCGVAFFYFLFPRYFIMRRFWKIVVQYVGIGSMIFAFFLFTQEHDLVLNIAGGLGGIALIGTLTALRHQKYFRLLWIGTACLFLICVNNYMYYTRVYVSYLPLIQKITLFLVLFWMLALNVAFGKAIQEESQ